MTIDPETLMAYADGELDEVAAKRVERAIAEDPALARQVEAHRALRARIAGHFAPIAGEPVPERLRTMIGNNAASIDEARARRSRWTLPRGNIAAMAATLVVGLLVGQAIDLNPAPVADRSGTLVAQAGLERALDTQLASEQPSGAATRIGLTFRDKAGAVCRTFEAQALAGIACRVDGAWQVRQMMGAEAQSTDYRQAGSAEMLAAAEAMMADGPLDADAERAARDGGWR
ncbi:anti-sigma factor family protein [Sphingomonas cavernae]|uniref:Anti-sigma factor n=1 Tax=Sphingomonas cavernae TaxID=2320861 RepID=A0A418W5W5_9SPHN|nr:anti-sigma factor [Sphingomonas cavernae]RJF85369.1 anti-sigma factor [Sphingomonas cavernae]